MKRKINLFLKNKELVIRRSLNSPMIYFMKNHSKEKELIRIEIGVEYGTHVLDLIKNLKIKRIYLIDPYLIYEGYKEPKRTKESMNSSEKYDDLISFAQRLPKPIKRVGKKLIKLDRKIRRINHKNEK